MRCPFKHDAVGVFHQQFLCILVDLFLLGLLVCFCFVVFVFFFIRFLMFAFCCAGRDLIYCPSGLGLCRIEGGNDISGPCRGWIIFHGRSGAIHARNLVIRQSGDHVFRRRRVGPLSLQAKLAVVSPFAMMFRVEMLDGSFQLMGHDQLTQLP